MPSSSLDWSLPFSVDGDAMRYRKNRGTILSAAAAMFVVCVACALLARPGPAPHATAAHRYALAELQRVEQWSPLLWSDGGIPAPAR